MINNLIQFSNEKFYSFLILFLLIFIYILYILFYKKRTTRQMCYENLDILKYVSSILIILFHINIYMKVVYKIDFIITDVITRLAVPFFFTIAGFLIAQNENKGPNYIKNYLIELFKTYLFWSILYLPFGLRYIINLHIAWYLYPIAILLGILYIGIYYHLWYFPALFFSICILSFWKKRWSISLLTFISFLLLIIGSSESYFGYFNDFWQNIFQTYYFSIFYTTRNFLFFGLFYVTLGYMMQKKQLVWKNQYNYLLIITLLFFTLDCMIAQTTPGIDRNILISAPFFVFFLFLRVLYSPQLLPFIDKRKLRRLSKYYFFVHPFVLELLFYFKASYSIPLIFFLSLTMTHILTLVCLYIKKHYPSLPM